MAALPSVADLLSGQTGYERGAQAFDNGYNGVRGMRVNDLAKSYFTGDPSTRDATLQQIAAINPTAADNIAKMGQAQEDRRNMQLANIARGVLSFKDLAAQRGVYQNTIMPAAKRQGLQIPEWDDATTPQWLQYQLARGGSAAGQGVQSTYVDGQGNRVAILRDGSTQVLGPNDAGANQQTLSVDIGGVPTQVTFDRRTGRYSTANLGGVQASPAPAPGLYNTPNGPIQIDNNLTPQEWQAVQADVASGGASNAYQLPPQSSGTPIVGRTKEAEAAAVEAAKHQAQMQYLPQELELRTQAAIQQANAEAVIRTNAALNQARGESQINNEATRAVTAQQNAVAYNLWATSLGNLKKSLGGTSTGPLVGRLPAVTTSQQIADGAVSQMAPVLKQLFRQAGEGTFTDRDQDLLIKMLPTRTDTPEAAAAKMDAVDAMVRAKLQVPGTSPVSPTPSGVYPQSGNYSNLWK